jgi:hypothetical protein
VTRPISDLDVPLPTLREEIAALVARQNQQRADRSADRLKAFIAPTPTRNDCAEEASK